MILENHLFADDQLVGAAPSDKTKRFHHVGKNLSLSPGWVRSVLDNDLKRPAISLAQIDGFACANIFVPLFCKSPGQWALKLNNNLGDSTAKIF
jgi:hypothetical protein